MSALAGLKFHHLGLALQNDDEALTMLKALGYECGEKIHDPNQNVYVRMCNAPEKPAVEIVLPGEGDSPLVPLVRRHNEMIYHTCYETDDLEATLAAVEKEGLRCLCIAGRRPAPLFGGRHVSFYKIFGFGIIELLENS